MNAAGSWLIARLTKVARVPAFVFVAVLSTAALSALLAASELDSYKHVVIGANVLLTIAWLTIIGTNGVLFRRLKSLRNKLAGPIYRPGSAPDEPPYAESAALLEAALNHMSQGLAMVSPVGEILVFNERAVEYAGIKKEHFTFPAKAADVFKAQLQVGEFGADGELAPEELRKFFKGEGPLPRSYIRRRPNGTVLEVRSEPMPAGGMVQSYTDITELVRAKDAAETAARAKSVFLATMSHEIRTPLNGVLGMAAVLREGRLTPEQRRNVDAITSCGDALLHIINDILDLSKLEAGMMEIEAAPFDLSLLINSAVDVTRGAASGKGIAIEVHTDPDLPRIVRGDRNRLRQALLNLLSNAVKFTEAGKVVLRAARGGSAGQLRIEVSDTGIGIEDEARDRLFKEFSQVDASISRRFGGTGLGLAITQRIVQAMQGRIGLDSEPGKGSCFWFEIPLAAVPDAVLTEDRPILEKRSLPVPVSAIAAGELTLSGQPGTGWRILVVEDMPVNQMVARGLLEARGHSADVAADGLEAIAKAEANDYDLILMDMQMPRMDGLEATRLIRARGGKLAMVPIVAMTANAFDSDQAACAEAGMNDFVSKPIDAERLREALDRVMSGRCAPAKQVQDIATAFNASPLEALRQQLGAAAVEDVIQCCKLEVPLLLRRVDACLEQSAAGELDDLLRSLEGALTNLGFIAATDYCRTQSEQLAAGKQPDAEFVKVLDRLVEDGWRMIDAIVAESKATEPLASAA